MVFISSREAAANTRDCHRRNTCHDDVNNIHTRKSGRVEKGSEIACAEGEEREREKRRREREKRERERERGLVLIWCEREAML